MAKRLYRKKQNFLSRNLTSFTIILLSLTALLLLKKHFTDRIELQGSAAGDEYFASPNGCSSGCAGTKSAPWGLKYALTQTSKLSGGDTLWLLPGTYLRGGDQQDGGYLSTVSGASGNPLTIRNYDGGRATIEPGIIHKGQYVNFWGLEFRNTRPRNNKGATHQRHQSVKFTAGNNKIINCIFNNTGHPAVETNNPSANDEVYGNLFWGTGVIDQSRSSEPNWIRGSALYAQNETGRFYVTNNISFKNFTNGLKSSGTSAGIVRGFRFSGNISFDNGEDWNIFANTEAHRMGDLLYENNYLYARPNATKGGLKAGHMHHQVHDDITVKNNYIVNGSAASGFSLLHIDAWKNGTVTGNTFVNRGGTFLLYGSHNVGAVFNWNSNNYYGPGTFVLDNSSGSTHSYRTLGNYDAWKNYTKFDGNSTYNSGRPSTNYTAVMPNKYEPGKRAHIVVFNWEGKDSVTVNMAGSGITANSSYVVKDAQNYWGPAVTQGIFNGSTITVPTNLTAVTEIIRPTSSDVQVQNLYFDHTPKEFNAYVVLVGSVGNGPAPTTPPTTTPPAPATPTASTPRPTTPSITPPPSNNSGTVFYPIADSMVKQSTPTQNYGTTDSLTIDAAPDPVSFVFLKFDLTSATSQTVSNAKLKFYVKEGSTGSFGVNVVTGSWDESTLTYSAYPPLGTRIATFTGGATNTWVEVDVSSFVRTNMGKVVTLALKTDQTNGMTVASKESINKPQFVITAPSATPIVTPPPTPIPTPQATISPTPAPQTVSIFPNADSMVKQSTPTQTYGSSDSLVVDYSPDPISFAFSRFDLTPYAGKSLISGKLRFYLKEGSSGTFGVNSVSNSWEESTISYSNYPALGTRLATFTGSATGTWVEIDLTAYLKANVGKVVSFGIKTDQTNGLTIASKENLNKPKLVLTISP